MIKVSFFKPSEIPDENLKFAVIAARYQSRWVFCRHKLRTTWEIPGGHREIGETIEQTARRELSEETGAIDAEIRVVSVYCVERDGEPSYGMLFFANIHRLGALPEDSEIGEVKLFETIPNPLTYPKIQPSLYDAIQGWLNIQSNAGELWDIYDENRKLTGRLHRRGDPLGKGEYHLVVHIWIRNSRGEFLLTERSPNKGFPHMWEATGGSALAGDDSLSAALREVREETGLKLDAGCGECIISFRGEDFFTDVWLFQQEFDLEDVILQEGETCDKMYATADMIRQLEEDGKLVPYSYLWQLLDRTK